MTSDTRTPDEIERDIEEERARMSGTINDLQKKFSVEGILGDLGDMFRDQGGDLTRSVGRLVGRNPAAVAVVGIGLAWLFIGRNRNRHDHSGRPSDRGGRKDSRQWTGKALPARPLADGAPNREGDRFWYAEAARPAQHGADRRQGAAHPRSQDSKAGNGNGSVFGAIRSGVDAVVDAAGSIGDSVMSLKDRLLHGTEGLSDEAKQRVLSARQAAHDARAQTKAAVTRGTQAAANLFEDQPLVIGALAVALGAAIGGVLPQSRIEDETLGASSDRLFDEAQKVFAEERAKATALVDEAVDEASSALRDTGAELAERLPDAGTTAGAIMGRVTDAANRVIDGATGATGNQQRPNRRTS